MRRQTQRTGGAQGEGAVAKVRCAAITRAGGRCKSVATLGSYCWNHAASTAEARKQRASRGGKAGGNGRPSGLSEIVDIKGVVRRVVDGVLNGTIERGVGAVAFQGLNTLLKAVEVERKIKEQDEVLERIEALEEGQPDTGGYRNWHR
jgi:hypothetical protein